MKRAVLPLLLLAGLLALSGCARSVRREPPALTVACAGAEWAAQRGGYSWSYRSGLRGRTSVVADTAHPLQCVGDGSLTAIPRGGEDRLSLRVYGAQTMKPLGRRRPLTLSAAEGLEMTRPRYHITLEEPPSRLIACRAF